MKLTLATFTNRLMSASPAGHAFGHAAPHSTGHVSAHVGRWSAAWGWIDTTRSRIMLLALVVVLGLTYLWLVNSTATAGFYLSDLEHQRVALEDEYQSLELEQAAVRSLDYIQQRGQALQLVGSGRAAYVASDTSVALSENE